MNNLLTKLATFKWRANPSTIRMTALALSYSTAEYTAPVWARSPHAKNMDPGQNQPCRSVTGCLKQSNVEDLYMLSGIASLAIRRDVCASVERQKQSTRDTHSLFGQLVVVFLPRPMEGFKEHLFVNTNMWINI